MKESFTLTDLEIMSQMPSFGDAVFEYSIVEIES